MTSAEVQRWLRVCAVFLIPGFLLAPVTFAPSTIVAVFLSATITMMLFSTMLRPDAIESTYGKDTRSLLPAAGYSALTGVMVISAAALVAASPWLAVLLTPAVIASSPWALKQWRRHNHVSSGKVSAAAHDLHVEGGDTSEVTIQEPASQVPGSQTEVLGELSNSQLCSAWRSSFVELGRATTAAQREHIVARRQSYLDEMENRDPRALSAWLDAGARAAGGPDRYLPDSSPPPN